MCEICSKLIKKTSERRQCRRFGVFIADYEQISYSALVFPVLALSNKYRLGSNFRKDLREIAGKLNKPFSSKHW